MAPGQSKARSLSFIKTQQHIDTWSVANSLLGLSLINHYGKTCKTAHCRSNCDKCPLPDCGTCVYRLRLLGGLRDFRSTRGSFYGESNRFSNFEWGHCTRQVAVTFLKAFAKTARKQRDIHYVALSDEARQYLNAEKVSDREIDKTLSSGILEDDRDECKGSLIGDLEFSRWKME